MAFYCERYLETKKKERKRKGLLHWFDFCCLAGLMQFLIYVTPGEKEAKKRNEMFSRLFIQRFN